MKGDKVTKGQVLKVMRLKMENCFRSKLKGSLHAMEWL